MPNNCLVTKLKSVVDNDNLEKLGVITLKAVEITGGTEDYSAAFGAADSAIEIKCTGTGKLQTSPALLISNPLDSYTIDANDSETLYFSNGTYDIEIHNKYDLRTLTITGNNKGAKLIHIGDLSKFKACSKLTTFFVFQNNYVSGDIRNILELPSIATVQVYNSPVSGEIKRADTVIPNINATKCYGDFTNILKTAANGNQAFYGYTEGGQLVKDGDCTADMSQTNKSVFWIVNGFRTQYSGVPYEYWNVSWKTTRPSDALILALNNLNFGTDLDAMLINQADCQYGSSTRTGSDLIIRVEGTHTADDADWQAAVATLKQKGMTVIINGQTL